MTSAGTVATASLTAAGFLTLGAAKLARTPFMRERAEHVGYSADSYQLIGLAESAGAIGVLAGLRRRRVGYVAGTGLMTLLGGALATHLLQGDGPADIAPAAVFAACTSAYLVSLGRSTPSRA